MSGTKRPSRIVLAAALFIAMYAGVLTLYFTAIGPAPADAPVLWQIWRGLGAASLSAVAAELTFLVLWLALRASRAPTSGGVPLHLTAADRLLLERRRPTLALVLPAHGEASTPADRVALADRLCDLIVKTPSWSTLFLLVDSPEDQRDNERELVRQVSDRLAAAGRDDCRHRLVLEEYRDKPPGWRHKCGSIIRWIERHGAQHQFMLLLDADSSLAKEDPAIPQTCDVVSRMLVAMLRDPDLAIVQAALQISDYRSPWGWVQAVNTRVGLAYYLPLFAWLYDRTAPCYGHNCLVRVADFARHARNTLHYTSHDHIDACDLAAAGKACVLSTAVHTNEGPEDSVLLWLKRECRWARGNGQWFVYLARKVGIPFGCVAFLLLGIFQYLWTLLTGLFALTGIALLTAYGRLFAVGQLPAAIALISLAVLLPMVPRLLASVRWREFAGGTALAMLLAPPIMLFQGMAFVLGAFGTRWVPRGTRLGTVNLAHMGRILATLAPISILGLILWPRIDASAQQTVGVVLARFMLILMILSPLSAMLVSRPLRRSASPQVDSAACP